MAANNKELNTTQKKNYLSVVLYIGSALVGLIGLSLLINNVIIFKNTVAQYVAQGYPAETVMESLIPGQLLPGVLEPLAVYGGIALLLFGLGKAFSVFFGMFCGGFTSEEVDADEEEEIQEYFKVFSIDEDDEEEYVEIEGVSYPSEKEEPEEMEGVSYSEKRI